MGARLTRLPPLALLVLAATAPAADAGTRTGIASVAAPSSVAQGETLPITARVRGPLASARWTVVLRRRSGARRVPLAPVEKGARRGRSQALRATVPVGVARGAYRLVVCLKGPVARRIARPRRCAKGPIVLIRRAAAALPPFVPPRPTPPPAPAPAPAPEAAPEAEPAPNPCPEPGPLPPAPEDTPPTPAYETAGYVPQARGGLPWRWTKTIPLDPPDRELAEDGSAVFRKDGVPCPHPAFLAQYALHLINGFRNTGDPVYLDRAIANAERMVATGVRRDGALYLAYRFRHHQGGGADDVMTPPWFSAMAQGQALSVLVRLAESSGDERWWRLADKVLLSFTQPRAEGGAPWCVWVDDEGYLWLEEYPNHQPMRVLNGHIAALYGLYDYALGRGDSPNVAAAKALYDGAVTTVRDRIGEFRVPGGLSLYDLRIRNSYLDYHVEHINMLRMLGLITRDPTFDRWKQTFEEDQREYESR